MKGIIMTRIPSHSIEDAPMATRSLLAEMVELSPTGRLLTLHAQMAHSPSVLAPYVGFAVSPSCSLNARGAGAATGAGAAGSGKADAGRPETASGAGS